eukprot:11177937-Lingulodinium_polyedra.AAC.1
MQPPGTNAHSNNIARQLLRPGPLFGPQNWPVVWGRNETRTYHRGHACSLWGKAQTPRAASRGVPISAA